MAHSWDTSQQKLGRELVLSIHVINDVLQIALGFGIASGIGEADAVEMDCKCARQFHESLKIGCEMKVQMSDFVNDGVEESKTRYRVSR